MDKETAIKLSNNYLLKVKKNNIDFSEAWLFGSYAKGNNSEDSDIDIAIILNNNNKSFEMEVMLMNLRSGEETIIEPHAFNKNDFNNNNPLVNEVLKTGIEIKLF